MASGKIHRLLRRSLMVEVRGLVFLAVGLVVILPTVTAVDVQPVILAADIPAGFPTPTSTTRQWDLAMVSLAPRMKLDNAANWPNFVLDSSA